MSDSTENREIDAEDVSEEGEFLFQVRWVRNEEGGIEVGVEFGLQANELPTDEQRLYALSQMMNSLAMRLATSSIGDEVDD